MLANTMSSIASGISSVISEPPKPPNNSIVSSQSTQANSGLGSTVPINPSTGSLNIPLSNSTVFLS